MLNMKPLILAVAASVLLMASDLDDLRVAQRKFITAGGCPSTSSLRITNGIAGGRARAPIGR